MICLCVVFYFCTFPLRVFVFALKQRRLASFKANEIKKIKGTEVCRIGGLISMTCLQFISPKWTLLSYYKSQMLNAEYSSAVIPSLSSSLCHIPQAGAEISANLPSKPNLRSARTAYLDHDASILIIHMVLSFYTQLTICYSSKESTTHFVRHKRRRKKKEIMERHRAKIKPAFSCSERAPSPGLPPLFRNTSKKIRILP